MSLHSVLWIPTLGDRRMQRTEGRIDLDQLSESILPKFRQVLPGRQREPSHGIGQHANVRLGQVHGHQFETRRGDERIPWPEWWLDPCDLPGLRDLLQVRLRRRDPARRLTIDEAGMNPAVGPDVLKESA